MELDHCGDSAYHLRVLVGLNFLSVKENAKILNIGCGKGFWLYKFKKQLPNCSIAGIDISKYALENAKEEVRPYLKLGNAAKLDFPDKSFDFIFSHACLYNLRVGELFTAIKEIERVKKESGASWISLESYRNPEEQVNLQCWSLTCRNFFDIEEWAWVFKSSGYRGDHEYF